MIPARPIGGRDDAQVLHIVAVAAHPPLIEPVGSTSTRATVVTSTRQATVAGAPASSTMRRAPSSRTVLV